MAANRWGREHPLAFPLHALAPVEHGYRPFRKGDDAPRVIRLAEGDSKCIVLDLIPSKSISFLRPKAAIEEDDRQIVKRKGISRFDRWLFALCCSNANERRLIGLQETITQALCSFEVSRLFFISEDALPPLFARKQRNLRKGLLDTFPFRRVSGIGEDLG